MEPEEREDVSALLAFRENTAAGHMTNEYLALSPDASVGDAIEKLRNFEGEPDFIGAIFVVDANEKLVGSVALVSLVVAPAGTRLGTLSHWRKPACREFLYPVRGRVRSKLCNRLQ